MIVHIDCNSFYASCEVSLRPDLQRRPVVVANCNEAGGGIILALTKEAKALGLKRGNPVFQVKETLDKYDVAVFPANLTKYVDISRRIMQVVKEQNIILDFKQYSIDEFFGVLPTDDTEELKKYIGMVKEAINHGIGVPVSCGASTTYTLAKVATWYAKRYAGYRGICILPEDKIQTALKGIPIGDIWGVGYRGAPKLKRLKIETGYDLAMKSEQYIRHIMSVTGVKTWKELHGIACIDITSKPQQCTIMHSRTFTYMVNDKNTLHEYISNYAAGAARKLRDEHSVCQSITVFIMTNRHRGDLAQYSGGDTITLTTATADTTEISKTAIKILDRIYREGYQYKRAGIVLGNISDDTAIQLDLFTETKNDPKRTKRLMNATDSINMRYGMNMIRLASQGNNTPKLDLKGFQPLKNQTTNINDIIDINCNK